MPREIQSHIVSYLNKKDIFTSVRVCHSCAEVFNREIKSFKLEGKVTDAKLMQLARRFSNLTSLHLGLINIITDGAVSKLTVLTRLDVLLNKIITDSTIEVLKKCGALKKVIGR